MTLRALIVDDHRDVVDSLAVLLQTLGATARAVYDGPCGLAAMLEFKPDIVFIDIRMSGMDGYETARRIRQGGHAHRFILVALNRLEPARRSRARSGGRL